jgi:hypothetical protein
VIEKNRAGIDPLRLCRESQERRRWRARNGVVCSFDEKEIGVLILNLAPLHTKQFHDELRTGPRKLIAYRIAKTECASANRMLQ